jgi:rhodanese-related sulfurtransferase
MPRVMDHLEPKQAHEFLRANADALFIDCRSEMEYLFVGHPVGAQHVAWNDGPDWDINPHFVGQVKRLAGTNHATRAIVLICRSGNRSQEAGETLERHGFARVYNVLHGFEGELNEKHQRNQLAGWRREGLPWEQC